MAAPRVSVIMPCWNAAPFLERCLESLRAQTLRDFELIVVDDGSTDETPKILARWAQRDPRIRVVRQEHAGLVAAPQRALEEARSDLVARIDSDDIAHPRRLEWQAALMEGRPEVSVVGGLVRFFPRAKMRAGMRRYERWVNSLTSHEEIMRDFFVENPLPHPGVMMRADAARAAGGYREAGWAEDYDLCFRLLERGARFEKVPQVVLWWRDRSERATRTQPRYAGTEFRRCKVHYLRRLHLGDRTRVQIWGAGKEGRALGKHIKRANLEIVRYIDIAPTKIGKVLLGAPIEDVGGLAKDDYLLVAVGAERARTMIREELTERGWSEPDDYRTMA